MTYRTEGYTHVGNYRANNEDAYKTDETTYWAIADGVGGSYGGEIASAKAMEIISTVTDADQLQGLFEEAHAWCRAHEHKPATTATSFMIIDGMVHWANVGDTRLYSFNTDYDFTLHTTDQGYGRMLFNCIGHGGWEGSPGFIVDTGSFPHVEGTTYLLSTDGVHDYIDPGTLGDILKQANGEQTNAAEDLCNVALQCGSKDNVTALVLWT